MEEWILPAVDINLPCVSITGTSGGAFVYRLGRGPLKAERRVRFPYALPTQETPQIQAFSQTSSPRRAKMHNSGGEAPTKLDMAIERHQTRRQAEH
jgi:hypothetical protein